MSKRPLEDSSSDEDSAMFASPENTASSEPVKRVALDVPDNLPEARLSIQCCLPPHGPLTFYSLHDHEQHYLQAHVNRCTACMKNMPSAHYLDIHYAECHDRFTDIRRENNEKVYACFMEDCERMFSKPRHRRYHLIDKHGFPTDYDFAIVYRGIDGRHSLLRSGAVDDRTQAEAGLFQSPTAFAACEGQVMPATTANPEPVTYKSALHLVPASVSKR